MPVLHSEAGLYVLDVTDQSKIPPSMRATRGMTAWPLKFRANVKGHVSGRTRAFNSEKNKSEEALIITVSDLVILTRE